PCTSPSPRRRFRSGVRRARTVRRQRWRWRVRWLSSRDSWSLPSFGKVGCRDARRSVEFLRRPPLRPLPLFKVSRRPRFFPTIVPSAGAETSRRGQRGFVYEVSALVHPEFAVDLLGHGIVAFDIEPDTAYRAVVESASH